MAKPTSMAAMATKTANDAIRADEREDEKIARRRAPVGQIWVRLIRPHFDGEGQYHEAGPALLNDDAIPSSAKRLTKLEAEAETADNDEDDE